MIRRELNIEQLMAELDRTKSEPALPLRREPVAEASSAPEGRAPAGSDRRAHCVRTG